MRAPWWVQWARPAPADSPESPGLPDLPVRLDLPVQLDLPDRKARRAILVLPGLLVPTERTVSRVPWDLLVLPVNVAPKGSRVRRDRLVRLALVARKATRVSPATQAPRVILVRRGLRVR